MSQGILIIIYIGIVVFAYLIGIQDGVKKYKIKLIKQKQDIIDYGRPQFWRPKVYVLLKDLPNVKKGARFQQTYQTDKIYFYGMPINADSPQTEQVGIINIEAKDVENNPKWFKEEYHEI